MSTRRVKLRLSSRSLHAHRCGLVLPRDSCHYRYPGSRSDSEKEASISDSELIVPQR